MLVSSVPLDHIIAGHVFPIYEWGLQGGNGIHTGIHTSVHLLSFAISAGITKKNVNGDMAPARGEFPRP